VSITGPEPAVPVQSARVRADTTAGDGVGRGRVDLEVGGIMISHRVRWHRPEIAVSSAEGQSSFVLLAADLSEAGGSGAGECRAPLPGSVTRVLVAVGDGVEEGAELIVMEAMKMEHTLRASGSGTVAEVRTAPGQQVDVGDLLVVIEPRGEPAVVSSDR